MSKLPYMRAPRRDPRRNVGLREALFSADHLARMGQAIWLYGWLVARQTQQRLGVGKVLGGGLLTYKEITEETGYPRRTLQRWMRRLAREGYITVDRGWYSKLRVSILKAKKFPDKQLVLGGNPQGFAQAGRSEVAHLQTQSGALKKNERLKDRKNKPDGPSLEVLKRNVKSASREYVRTNKGNGAKRAFDEANAELQEALREFRSVCTATQGAPVAARKAF